VMAEHHDIGIVSCELLKILRMGIPMMSISHSDLMSIRAERSDAGLSQCEIVIGIRQDFCLFSLT
jgi:hypothetical protein